MVCDQTTVQFIFILIVASTFNSEVSSENCPKKITISSNRRIRTINVESWKDKVGSYSLNRLEFMGDAVYEHAEKKGNFLFRTPDHNAWMVGDQLGKDFGWIANSNCTSKCPTDCSDGTWMYWHGVSGGKGAWKVDDSMRVDGCVKWRQTGRCLVNGPREPENDKTCDETIEWKSGYCECSNGRTAMEKGCDLPSFHGFSYSTCDEACAYEGTLRNSKTTNEGINNDGMQADQPYPDKPTPASPSVDVRPTYTFNGHRFWSCSAVARRSYPNYISAMTACLNKRQCSFVLDAGCNDSGPFKLCTAMSFIERSSNDCIYTKEGLV